MCAWVCRLSPSSLMVADMYKNFPLHPIDVSARDHTFSSFCCIFQPKESTGQFCYHFIQAEQEQVRRARVSEEEKVLKECEDRAATLRSEVCPTTDQYLMSSRKSHSSCMMWT